MMNSNSMTSGNACSSASAPSYHHGSHVIVSSSFPRKMYTMLEDAETKGFEHIISWQTSNGGGKSFKIHQPDVFASTVLQSYFAQSKFKSFQRQLNIYGWKKVPMGPHKGGYSHKYFQRGHPQLCDRIVRKDNRKPPPPSDPSSSHPPRPTWSSSSGPSVRRSVSPRPPPHNPPRRDGHGNGHITTTTINNNNNNNIDKKDLFVMEVLPPIGQSYPKAAATISRHVHQKSLDLNDGEIQTFYDFFYPLTDHPHQDQGHGPDDDNHDHKESNATGHAQRPGSSLLYTTDDYSVSTAYTSTSEEVEEDDGYVRGTMGGEEGGGRRRVAGARNDPHDSLLEEELEALAFVDHHRIHSIALESGDLNDFVAMLSDDLSEMGGDDVGPSMVVSEETNHSLHSQPHAQSHHHSRAATHGNQGNLLDGISENDHEEQRDLERREVDYDDEDDDDHEEAEPGDDAGETSFPFKVYTMLENASRDGYSHIVSWVKDGRAFKVHSHKEFLNHVMPMYFDQSKYESFRRQLNLYQFSRVARGVDRGIISHPHLRAGNRALCGQIKRGTPTLPTSTKQPFQPVVDQCSHAAQYHEQQHPQQRVSMS